MKITKRQLRRIIKEAKVLKEYSEHAGYQDLQDALDDIFDMSDALVAKYATRGGFLDQEKKNGVHRAAVMKKKLIELQKLAADIARNIEATAEQSASDPKFIDMTDPREL